MQAFISRSRIVHIHSTQLIEACRARPSIVFLPRRVLGQANPFVMTDAIGLGLESLDSLFYVPRRSFHWMISALSFWLAVRLAWLSLRRLRGRGQGRANDENTSVTRSTELSIVCKLCALDHIAYCKELALMGTLSCSGK